MAKRTGKSRRRTVKIMVIRHAEKPPKDAPAHGVTVEGKREKESLSVRGWQRAGALAGLFAPRNGSFADASLARPRFLYASKPTKRNGSKRPVETITPLAEKLNLEIDDSFSKLDLEAMLDDVFSRPGAVLISWQYEYIPQIANYILGNKTTAPQDWPDDRFDLVWVFDLNRRSGRYRFKQVAQRLLMGDRANLIR